MNNDVSRIQGRNGESENECYTALHNWLTKQGFESVLEENCVIVEITPEKYYGVSVFLRSFYNVYIQADDRFRFILKENIATPEEPFKTWSFEQYSVYMNKYAPKNNPIFKQDIC